MKNKKMYLLLLLLMLSVLIVSCNNLNDETSDKQSNYAEEVDNVEKTGEDENEKQGEDIEDIKDINEDDEDIEVVLGDKARISKEEIESLYKNDPNMLLYFSSFSGRMAPDFEMEDLDGKRFKLSDLKGENVIIEFMASWCPVCIDAMLTSEEFNKEYKDARIISIGVNETVENLVKVKEEKKVENVDFYLSIDDVIDIYDLFFVPIYFYIDSEGYVQMIIAGDASCDMLKDYADKSFK